MAQLEKKELSIGKSNLAEAQTDITDNEKIGNRRKCYLIIIGEGAKSW